MAIKIENEHYVVSQGAAGSLRVQFLAGDVVRAVQKLTKDAQVEMAAEIAAEARKNAPVRAKPKGPKKYRSDTRLPGDMKKSITSGETKTGNAYVKAAFPAAFVELGHRVANQHTGRLKGKKKKAAKVVEPRPFLRPALDSKIGGLKAKIEQRQL